MDMLARDDWCDRMTLLRRALVASVLELQALLLEASLDSGVVTMLEIAMLDCSHIVRVLFG